MTDGGQSHDYPPFFFNFTNYLTQIDLGLKKRLFGSYN